MKKQMKHLLMAMIAAVLAVSILTGCSGKPTAEDAEAYVQAVMDLMCKGDYDHSIKIADVEEGQESALRDQVISDAMDDLGTIDISDSVKESFREVLDKALTKCKYSIVDSEGADDGGYDVSVKIEPIILFDGLENELMNELSDTLSDESQVAAMSERELNDLVYSTMIKLMAEKLEEPAYDTPETVKVHYGPLPDQGKNVYGVSEEDGEKLGSFLFSTKGLE